MKPVITIADLQKTACAVRNPHLFASAIPATGKKASKYRNKKTEVAGITFDSAKEADYYKKLLLLQKAGEIGLIERQVEYELNPGGSHSLRYVADFRYMEARSGRMYVVDVKGFKTREYLKKRRLMKKVWGIEIVEI